ncbi:MAG: hypothetical protein KA765_11175 [Thermoflexales bacterium]|nr:hypothetical protein [Thermoflexales bacterium]
MAVQFSVAAPLAAPQAGEVTVCTWLGCKSGAVSYTQDDHGNVLGDNSCRTQLEHDGLRGTFFFDGLDVTTTWMTDYVAAGHEIGSHLTSHLANCQMPHPTCEPNCTLADLRLTPYTQTVVEDFRENQIDLNVSLIESYTNQPVVSMAYPCGSTDANRMAASDLYFLSARGYYNRDDGADFPWITYTNGATLPDAMLINSDGVGWQRLTDEAISEGKWAVLTMHDYCFGVGDDSSYIVSRTNSLWVAPVGEVLKYIKVRDAFRFGNYVSAYNSINFDAGHSLNTMTRQTFTGTTLLPIVFDNPVTLNVDVPIDKGVSTVLVDGVPVSFTTMGITNSVHSVLFTTTLGITRHVSISLTGPTTVQLQDFDANSDSELGHNLGWLFAMILMGTGGLVGVMRANRRQARPQ